uniref:Secreted protein n=1 Tax=Globodera pallida TaxID=36090 RepID=A0A183C2H7_GLOPA
MTSRKLFTFAALLLFIKLGNENASSTHVETSISPKSETKSDSNIQEDGGLSAQDLDELIEQAKIMAMNVGLITRTKAHKDKNDEADISKYTHSLYVHIVVVD